MIALGTAGLVASGLSMPEDGVLNMAIHNPARLGRLIGGRPSVFATLNVYAATITLLVREWIFFRAFVVRQLRRMGVPPSSRKARTATRRLNESAERLLITQEGVLRRFPDLKLAGDPIPQEMELFSGLASLPVRSHACLS